VGGVHTSLGVAIGLLWVAFYMEVSRYAVAVPAASRRSRDYLPPVAPHAQNHMHGGTNHSRKPAIRIFQFIVKRVPFTSACTNSANLPQYPRIFLSLQPALHQHLRELPDHQEVREAALRQAEVAAGLGRRPPCLIRLPVTLGPGGCHCSNSGTTVRGDQCGADNVAGLLAQGFVLWCKGWLQLGSPPACYTRGHLQAAHGRLDPTLINQGRYVSKRCCCFFCVFL
jgi:hypothetical protein